MKPELDLESLTKKNLLQSQRLGLIVALLMSAASFSGIIFPDLVYIDPVLRETFLVNDIVNLIIGLPLFITGLIMLRRNKPLGFFLLPGALVYVIYNYFAYLVARPLSIFTIINLLLVFLAGYSLIDLLTRLDHEVIRTRLEGSIPRKWSGWLLVFMGAGFFFLALYQNINSLLLGEALPLGVQVASLSDMLVSSLWAGGGILLLRNKGLGYTAGLGLLIAASSLFIGLILFFFLDPLVAGKPIDLVGVITVFVMGLICFIPTALYWRGVVRNA